MTTEFKIKRSTINDTPTIKFGELAITSISGNNNLFIGDSSDQPINIAGSIYAKIDSQTLTGTPSAPTPLTSDNSTKLATTAFVKNVNSSITGDVSINSSQVSTIGSSIVSNSKLSNMNSNTIKGNNTNISSTPLDLSILQTNTMLSVNNNVYYISVNGSDTNNGLSLETAVLTLNKVLTLVGTTKVNIIISPGTYTENTTISNSNISLFSLGNLSVIFSGTITINGVNSNNISLYSIDFTNLSHVGNSNLYLDSCIVSTSLILSGNGNVQFNSCNLSGTINITGSGTKTFQNGSYLGNTTINNNDVLVNMNFNNSCKVLTLTNGIVNINNTNIYSPNSNSDAIIATNGTLKINSSQILNENGSKGKVNLSNIVFSYYNIVINYTDSIFSNITYETLDPIYDSLFINESPLQIRLTSNDTITSFITTSDFHIYDINTTSSAFIVNLPSDPVDSSIIYFTNYSGSFGNNNLTIHRNGHKINNANSDFICNTSNGVYLAMFSLNTTSWVITSVGGSGGSSGGLSDTLNYGNVFVGNLNNKATGVLMSGHISISDTGNTTIQNNIVSNSKLETSNLRTWKGNNTDLVNNVNDNNIESLTENNSNVLTITGTNNILNTTTIEVKQSSTTQSGYLSSTDWTTFNDKQDRITAPSTNNNIIISDSTGQLQDGGRSITSLINSINESSPVGIINALYGSTIPSGWLLCDGTTFSGSIYPDLSTFLGSTTLPDLRGYFLRGLDTTGTVDRQAGRTLKSIQADDNKSHNHTATTSSGLSGLTYSTDEGGNGTTNICITGNTTVASSMLSHTHTITVATSGGLENKPKNVAINYIIRARNIV